MRLVGVVLPHSTVGCSFFDLVLLLVGVLMHYSLFCLILFLSWYCFWLLCFALYYFKMVQSCLILLLVCVVSPYISFDGRCFASFFFWLVLFFLITYLVNVVSPDISFGWRSFASYYILIGVVLPSFTGVWCCLALHCWWFV